MGEYGPIKVDVDQLANGILKLIHKAGYGPHLAFGMLPADIMQALEKNLTEKFPDSALMIGDKIIWEDEIKKIKLDIIHDVSVKIYKLASERGQMVV